MISPSQFIWPLSAQPVLSRRNASTGDLAGGDFRIVSAFRWGVTQQDYGMAGRWRRRRGGFEVAVRLPGRVKCADPAPIPETSANA